MKIKDVNICMNEINAYLSNLIKYDRLTGGKGESDAVDYIIKELGKNNIEYHIHEYSALLSNPIDSDLLINSAGEEERIVSKTRSFSYSTDGRYKHGNLMYIPSKELNESLIVYELNKNKAIRDLEDKIIISETMNPISVLELQNRGAVGYIQFWEGEEELIHEGIFNPIWGTPDYNELNYYPRIPILAINGKDGKNILEKIKYGNVRASIMTKLTNSVKRIPVIEAIVKPYNSSNDKFILIGNHLDSWYYGATDNGTGNALALYLAKYFNEAKEVLEYEIRIAWWTGHSNGRYAGSSCYASDNYLNLKKSCISYVNIDMPGLKGAEKYNHISAGPELYHVAAKHIKELTNQDSELALPVRGWDQSFQNIGITPLFVWASTLEENHQYTTGNSLMPWWWHTEEDLIDYYDESVLELDAKLYINTINDLAYNGLSVFDISKVFDVIVNRLLQLSESNVLQSSLLSLAKSIRILKSSFIKAENSLMDSEKIAILRELNQIYYVKEESHKQDFALQGEPIPGLSELINIFDDFNESEDKLVLNYQLQAELNRIYEKIDRIELILN